MVAVAAQQLCPEEKHQQLGDRGPSRDASVWFWVELSLALPGLDSVTLGSYLPPSRPQPPQTKGRG